MKNRPQNGLGWGGVVRIKPIYIVPRRPRNRSSKLGTELTRYEPDRERLELAKKLIVQKKIKNQEQIIYVRSCKDTILEQ
jgi:CRISPR/Cas system-associated endonuclease Cas1